MPYMCNGRSSLFRLAFPLCLSLTRSLIVCLAVFALLSLSMFSVCRLVDTDHKITMDLEWRAPRQTLGTLVGYRVRYGRKNGDKLTDIKIKDPNVHHQEIAGLEKGIEYEFRVAGVNNVGPGQETIIPYLTPEGVPTDAPKNITWRFQTPDVVEIVYDPPPEHARNGQIILYEIQFWKGADPNQKKLRSTNAKKAVFANLDDNTEYKFSVRANTRKGYGPWSTQQTFRTDRNIVRAPLGVKAMATSDSSLEVIFLNIEAVSMNLLVRIFYLKYL